MPTSDQFLASGDETERYRLLVEGTTDYAIYMLDPTGLVTITDQVMPHMNGLQLVDAIKAEWPDLPVIIATGYADLPPGSAINFPRLSRPYTQAELAHEIIGYAPRTHKARRVLRFRGGAKGKS
jgi:CheY-like chemotaxis protein